MAPWFWKKWPPCSWAAFAWLCVSFPAYRTSAYGRPWQDTQ